MKVFTIVIHPSCQPDFSDKLRMIGFVKNFMFTHLEWHGEQQQTNEALSMRDQVIGHIPKIRVDILIEDGNLKKLFEEIQEISGVKGQSIYWVTTVDEMEEL